MAEELGVEGASTLRKQDLMFAILKVQAEQGEQIMGARHNRGACPTASVSCAAPESNYLAGPDDIYVSPNQVRKFGTAHRRHGGGRDPCAPRTASDISR